MRSSIQLICGLIFLWGTVQAQFSPGKLSRYHAQLEGNANCEKCHELRKRELSDGCVECHTPLKERIAAGLGYHRHKTDQCGSCHSDHNGVDFELVYWPRDISSFDHSETGYRLTGKHIDLKCNQCHTRDFIVGKSIITWAGENPLFPILDRTFLGLSSKCKSCHSDVHNNEVGTNCAKCHNTLDWKRARQEFDHQQAGFLLTGAHQQVDCVKCHKVDELRTPKVWQLTGMAFDQCGRCHADQHQGAYGATCETCHTTGDWKRDLKPFNHSRTKYPLTGKHAALTCNQCHTKELTGKLPQFGSCLDCHSDWHLGQFADRKDQGDCTACHTVYGFKPTRFTTGMHNLTTFVLDGAHLAVPCNLCHKPFEPQPGTTSVRYTWPTLNCETCHEDLHRGQFQVRYQNRCESCHNTTDFKVVDFDHQKTNFLLDGKHRNVPCNQCHLQPLPATSQPVRYYPLPHRCADCHTLTDQIR